MTDRADCGQVRPDLAVGDLFTCWHETLPVFLRHRMACIGCPMALFETLEGAARVYGLDLPTFLQELQLVISSQAGSTTGDPHIT
jgi:hybrid cluster-associated redox disulfide protein